jgi:hypothetical protein
LLKEKKIPPENNLFIHPKRFAYDDEDLHRIATVVQEELSRTATVVQEIRDEVSGSGG